MCGSGFAAETNQVITLAWDYPAAETNVVFKLYWSGTLAVPWNQWKVMTNLPGTVREISIAVQPREMFFVITSSNFWGESDPSNTASTPPPPRSPVLSVRRGK